MNIVLILTVSTLCNTRSSGKVMPHRVGCTMSVCIIKAGEYHYFAIPSCLEIVEILDEGWVSMGVASVVHFNETVDTWRW